MVFDTEGRVIARLAPGSVVVAGVLSDSRRIEATERPPDATPTRRRGYLDKMLRPIRNYADKRRPHG